MPQVLIATEVVSQISLKLLQGFSDEITTVYKDTPLSGMIKPCFFIQQINTTHTKELRQRGERTYYFDIRLHPKDKEDCKQTWCNTMGDKLFSVLDSIVISNQLVRASNMRFEIIDNVLHFFVNYSFKVTKLEPDYIKMRTLDTEGNVNYSRRR